MPKAHARDLRAQTASLGVVAAARKKQPNRPALASAATDKQLQLARHSPPREIVGSFRAAPPSNGSPLGDTNRAANCLEARAQVLSFSPSVQLAAEDRNTISRNVCLPHQRTACRQ